MFLRLSGFSVWCTESSIFLFVCLEMLRIWDDLPTQDAHHRVCLNHGFVRKFISVAIHTQKGGYVAVSCKVSQCFGIDTSRIEPIGKVMCVMTSYKIVAEKLLILFIQHHKYFVKFDAWKDLKIYAVSAMMETQKEKPL